jgi:hypothetical protein
MLADSLNPVTLTTAVTVDDWNVPGLGLTNTTFAPGAPTFAAGVLDVVPVDGPAGVEEADDEDDEEDLLDPHPATSAATDPTITTATLNLKTPPTDWTPAQMTPAAD